MGIAFSRTELILSVADGPSGTTALTELDSESCAGLHACPFFEADDPDEAVYRQGLARLSVLIRLQLRIEAREPSTKSGRKKTTI
jgi:hypothetical protein